MENLNNNEIHQTYAFMILALVVSRIISECSEGMGVESGTLEEEHLTQTPTGCSWH